MSTSFDAPTTAIDDITGDYTIDASHSRLGFVARHAMVTKVRGQFGAFEGTAHIDAATPADSRVDLTIDVASVDTGSADRDGHLKSGDFFDVEQLPDDHLHLHRGRARRRRLDRHRRPHHQGRHQVRHDRLRADRLGPRPLRQPARRLRGRDHHQPQGLRPHLERRARDRRRPRLREDQARVRRLGDPQRLIPPAHRAGIVQRSASTGHMSCSTTAAYVPGQRIVRGHSRPVGGRDPAGGQVRGFLPL